MLKIPAIPDCAPEPRSLQNTVLALKEAVELLSGQRHGSLPPVTWEDLVRLGLIEQQDVPQQARGPRGT